MLRVGKSEAFQASKKKAEYSSADGPAQFRRPFRWTMTCHFAALDNSTMGDLCSDVSAMTNPNVVIHSVPSGLRGGRPHLDRTPPSEPSTPTSTTTTLWSARCSGTGPDAHAWRTRRPSPRSVASPARPASPPPTRSPRTRCATPFVTEALAAGVPLQDVQDAAGHRDPRTTRRYDEAATISTGIPHAFWLGTWPKGERPGLTTRPMNGCVGAGGLRDQRLAEANNSGPLIWRAMTPADVCLLSATLVLLTHAAVQPSA